MRLFKLSIVSFLAFASIFLHALISSAGIYNYMEVLVGEKAAGMGGAFSAIADDATAKEELTSFDLIPNFWGVTASTSVGKVGLSIVVPESDNFALHEKYSNISLLGFDWNTARDDIYIHVLRSLWILIKI